MKPDVLAKLRSAQDFRLPTRAAVTLCESFGPVRSFECVRFVHDGSEQVVLCFIELESEAQQMDLILGLGAYPFGKGACLKIPMQADFTGVTYMHSALRTRDPAPAVEKPSRRNRALPGCGFARSHRGRNYPTA